MAFLKNAHCLFPEVKLVLTRIIVPSTWTHTHGSDAISMAFALIHCALTIKPSPCAVAYRLAVLLCISSHTIHHCMSISTSSPLPHQPAIDLLSTLTHTDMHTDTFTPFGKEKLYYSTMFFLYSFQIAHNLAKVYPLGDYWLYFWLKHIQTNMFFCLCRRQHKNYIAVAVS